MNKFDELVEQADKTAQCVVSMTRDDVGDMDSDQSAFAFVLGTEEGDVMILSASISGDNKELTASISTFADGEPVPATVMQVDNSVLITSSINT